jgi:hypothetical protein
MNVCFRRPVAAFKSHCVRLTGFRLRSTEREETLRIPSAQDEQPIVH